jgi:hypothetical protein
MSLDDLDTAARWQAIAADARAAAAKASDPEAKGTLLTIAAGYEHLAERALEDSKDDPVHIDPGLVRL